MMGILYFEVAAINFKNIPYKILVSHYITIVEESNRSILYHDIKIDNFL